MENPVVEPKESQQTRCKGNLFWFFVSVFQIRINKVKIIFIKAVSIKFNINNSWSTQSKALARTDRRARV